MIPSLKSKKKIETVFEKGKVLKSGSVFLRFHDFNDDEISFGISVPKKNFKSAVLRNRIKRQIREIIRNNSDIKKIKKGISFFIIYNGKTNPNFDYLKEVVLNSIEKI
jgi:ribonuclease P protein component